MSSTTLTPAAQYLRMSTDHQQYSLLSQTTAIRQYADVHGFTLMKTYEDPGKSGLSLKYRKGLGSLLHDVVSGDQLYKAILVYDVSRWGRFQDTDEAAHYEFVCKSAGVPVHYCAEPFTSDITMPNTIMKALKRVMAGEYSRELGVKVNRAKRIVAELGFRAGGAAGYGLRRMLLSGDGTPKRLLEMGEVASLENSKVTLVHGSARDVALVREIYRLAICEKKGAMAIARDLNRTHIKHPGRLLWNYQHILEILKNPKYVGSAVYGRTVGMLGAKVVKTRPYQWVVKPDAYEQIVDMETFAAAERVLHDRTFYQSDEELLDRLRLLLSREGFLSGFMIDRARDVPATRTYVARFGTMKRAYDLIGYVYTENLIGSPKIRKIMWQTRQRRTRLSRRLVQKICKLFAGEVRTTGTGGGLNRPTLLFCDGLRVSVVICPAFRTPLGALRWAVPRLYANPIQVTLLCRCNGADDAFRDLYLINMEKRSVLRIGENDPWLRNAKRLTDLSKLRRVAQSVQRRARQARSFTV
ncbi:MAG: recombinase family protein [Candidatus Sulfotelmatobacter sp.]